mmetsp:Transcript_8186/g.10035  ORF Transcript_8186/g.10035 Transcript_8186/m.10035 type:complete len:81 (-) Transcript_8186:248-490(-)
MSLQDWVASKQSSNILKKESEMEMRAVSTFDTKRLSNSLNQMSNGNPSVNNRSHQFKVIYSIWRFNLEKWAFNLGKRRGK